MNIGNREKAIKNSIKNANPNEIILIAGKGHEEEQVYKNKTLKISDRKIVKNCPTWGQFFPTINTYQNLGDNLCRTGFRSDNFHF